MSRIPFAEVQGLVESAAQQFGIDPALARGIIAAENTGTPEQAANFTSVMPQARSTRNAVGVMQVTPIALKEAQNRGLIPKDWKHEDLRTDVAKGIQAGMAYLKYLSGVSTDPVEIAAMYNAGPTGGRQAVLPTETQLYSRKFKAAMGIPVDKPTPQQLERQVMTGTQMAQNTTRMADGGIVNSLGDTLTQILGSLISSEQAIQTAGNTMIQSAQANQALGQQNIAAGQMVNQLTQQLAGQKAEIEFRANSVAEQTQALLGMDPEQAENELTRSVAAMTAAQQNKAAVRAEYDQLSQVDFLSNPIGYIFAQLKMPSVAARHDNLAAAEASATANIDTRLNLIKKANSTLTANTAAAAKELTLGAARANAEAATIKLREEEMKNNSAGATAAMQVAQLQDKVFDNRYKAMNLKIQTAQWEDSQALRRMQWQERTEQQQARLEDKKAKDAADAALGVGLQRVSQALGMPQAITVADFKLMPTSPYKNALAAAAFNNGFGPDLKSSIATLFELKGDAGAIQNQNPGFAAMLRNTRAGIDSYATSSPATDKLGKPLSAKDKAAGAMDKYEQEVEESYKIPNAAKPLNSSAWDAQGGVFNPYKAEHEVMLDLARNGKTQFKIDNNVWAKALDNMQATTIKDPGAPIPAEAVNKAVDVVVELVKNGQVDPAMAAAHITAYHREAAARNMQFYNYTLMGLPPQDAYRVRLTPKGRLWGRGDAISVDFMNQAQTEKALVTLARESSLSSMSAPNMQLPMMAPGMTSIVRGATAGMESLLGPQK